MPLLLICSDQVAEHKTNFIQSLEELTTLNDCQVLGRALLAEIEKPNFLAAQLAHAEAYIWRAQKHIWQLRNTITILQENLDTAREGYREN